MPTKSSATADGPRDALYVSQNLVDCCTIVGASCTTNPEPIEVVESENYGRRTCNNL